MPALTPSVDAVILAAVSYESMDSSYMTKTSVAGAGGGVATAYVVLGFLVAGVIDYITGVEIRVYPLYFLPVCLAAWRLGHVGAAIAVVAATAIWVLSNIQEGLVYWQRYVFLINTFAQFVAFTVVASLLRYARVLLDREKTISSIDRTTSLFNTRGFFPLVQLALASCRRGARPLTLAYLDLDNFKCVNDTFGHQRGDALLCDVAGTLKSTLRASDIVARLGGDEFAVCLPETDKAQAVLILERLRERLSAVTHGYECNVSASIGAVSWDIPPDDIEAMIFAADSVMYRVKRAGKNRIEIEAGST